MANMVKHEQAVNGISEILASFYSRMEARGNKNRFGFAADLFEESLGDMADAICGECDLDGATFWRQADFYRARFTGQRQKEALRFLLAVYREAAKAHPEMDMFADSPRMTNELLSSSRLSELIRKEYIFATFTPGMDLGRPERVCLILRGYNDISTRVKAEDHKNMDLSSLDEPFYRGELFAFWTSSPSRCVTGSERYITAVAEALRTLAKAKRREGYPNSDPRFLNSAEAAMLHEIIGKTAKRISTKNNEIGSLRRFFLWEAEERGNIRFDDTFFDYMRQFEEPSKGLGRAIPSDDVGKLAALLRDRKDNSGLNHAVYVAFRLALETEFRISQILHLRADCIAPGTTPGQYIIRTSSKTSHGAPESYAVTASVKKLLDSQIAASESARPICHDRAIASYAFLFVARRGNSSSVKCLSLEKFNDILAAACGEAGIAHYTATNLRDTHMTLAQEHIMRNGKSDMELGILSRHRHLDTTKNHYISREFQRMLEATGGALLDDGDDIGAAAKVLPKLPPGSELPDRVVEKGCGSCTAPEGCSGTAFECRVCKHFRTTPSHESFWYEDIERQKRAIEATDLPHVKEDRLNLIRIAELYLLAIERLKEAKDDRG